MNNIIGIIAIICAIYVIYDVFAVQKRMSFGSKVLWTIFALLFSILTGHRLFFHGEKEVAR